MSLASTPGVTTNIRKEELSPRLGRFLLDVDRSTTPPSPQLQHRPLHLSNNDDIHSISSEGDQVDLVSLIGSPFTLEHIPRYTLRADQAIKYNGYKHSDWIRTPIIPDDIDLDLSPELIRETFNYFRQCGDRVSQMTKTYDDIQVVTRLLEEKERDIELAARIGQNLLSENEELKTENEALIVQLEESNDKIQQLIHDLKSKDALLHIYDQDSDEDFINSPSDHFNGYTVNMAAIHSKVESLELENHRLKVERDTLEYDVSELDAKEQSLTAECVRQLHQQSVETSQLQMDLATKTEVASRKQEEITTLITRQLELENIVKRMHIANSELCSHLSKAQSSQSHLTKEVSNLSKQYLETTELLQDARDEIQIFNLQQKPCIIRQNYGASSPYLQEDSLAFELRRSLGLDGPSSSFSNDLGCASPIKERRRYIHNIMKTVEAVQKSCKARQAYDISTPSSYNGDIDPISSTDVELALKRMMMRKANDKNADYVNSLDNIDELQVKSSPLTSGMNFRPTPKLIEIVKPMQGSEMLRQWQKLATPSFCLKTERPGILSRDGGLDNMHLLRDELFSLNDIEAEEIDPAIPRFTNNTSYTYTMTTSQMNYRESSSPKNECPPKVRLQNLLPKELNIIEAKPLDFDNLDLSIKSIDDRQATTDVGLNTIMNLSRNRGQCSRIVEDTSISSKRSTLASPMMNASSLHLHPPIDISAVIGTPMKRGLSPDSPADKLTSLYDISPLKFNFPLSSSTPMKQLTKLDTNCYITTLNQSPLSSSASIVINRAS